MNEIPTLPKGPKRKPSPRRIIRPTLQRLAVTMRRIKRAKKDLKSLRVRMAIKSAHPEAVEKELAGKAQLLENHEKGVTDYLAGLVKPRCILSKKQQRELGLIPSVDAELMLKEQRRIERKIKCQNQRADPGPKMTILATEAIAKGHGMDRIKQILATKG